MHYELLEHPSYSPDLAPSDFYLFPKLKLFLASQRFSFNQEAIAAVVTSISGSKVMICISNSGSNPERAPCR